MQLPCSNPTSHLSSELSLVAANDSAAFSAAGPSAASRANFLPTFGAVGVAVSFEAAGAVDGAASCPKSSRSQICCYLRVVRSLFLSWKCLGRQILSLFACRKLYLHVLEVHWKADIVAICVS